MVDMRSEESVRRVMGGIPLGPANIAAFSRTTLIPRKPVYFRTPPASRMGNPAIVRLPSTGPEIQVNFCLIGHLWTTITTIDPSAIPASIQRPVANPKTTQFCVDRIIGQQLAKRHARRNARRIKRAGNRKRLLVNWTPPYEPMSKIWLSGHRRISKKWVLRNGYRDHKKFGDVDGSTSFRSRRKLL